ncbi:DUF1015 family protein [Lacticaseibacillus absianus]|uniref:DUF1015 family protein n=1 Tax=Lacticaseibacillus absianus TaxID=2729623 RepID=UPI0015C69873|nr:DUF1015 family protein [Lacticaseibacillus absianus]
MVKLEKLANSYVNVSGTLYDSEFINLVQIKNDQISFDDRTIFLDQAMKDKLNAEAIVKHTQGVYVIDNQGRKGLICDLPITEYQRGAVKNHELVLPETIQGMLSNYHGYNAEAAPVMLIAKQAVDLDAFVAEHPAELIYTVASDQLYYYTGTAADELLAAFGDTDALYVGDGHHRLYSTSLSGFKQYVLSYVISIDSVDILPIHRQLPHLTDAQFDAALRFLQTKFKVESVDQADEAAMAPQKDTVMMYRGGQAWRVHLITLLSDGFWNNDIYRLNTQIIQQAFRTFDDRKLRYLSEVACAKAMRRSTHSVFFKVAPMTKAEFTESANQGNILPPKSTWMSPKAPSLLVMSKYQE